MIKLIIPGDPVAQGRPRFARIGKSVTAYDPKSSKDYKKKIIDRVKLLELNDQLDQPLEVTINVYRPIQKSNSKKKHAMKLSGAILPIQKPDLDNYIKGILDGLSQANIWTDDNLICVIKAQKVFSDRPHAEVIIKEISVDTDGNVITK